MLPTFHLNNFKPWAPPNRKPLPPQKSPNSCSPSTQNPPRTKIYHNSITSTLPSPKHHLPARPPAEVCVLANAGSQSCLPPSNPRSEPREITAPEPHTYPGILRRGTKAPNDLAAHSSEPDVVSRCNLQENTGISTKPPPFRGDTAEDGLSSPSISSSGNCLEELLRLPDSEDDIPIDPLILADHGSWEDMGLQLSTPQVADSLIDSETICPYPDLLPDLCSSTGHFQDRSKRFSGQKDSTRASDHHHIYDNQQVRSSQQNTGPDASYSNGTRENHHISASETPTSAKRKLQQINEGARKRSRVSSMLPLRECSFAALRSHFVSLPLDERLQFLSWLFEGALSCCMSEYPPTASNQGEAQAVSCSTVPDVNEQGRRGSTDVHKSSRKGMKWSAEESDLLLKLRKDEKRPWAEVIRRFSEEYPGRSPGAIQVHWSTTLSKKED